MQPFGTFLKDGLEEVLSLEGRLFRGIRDLLTRPGFLTEEYWRGRRARHMHPIRLFLVSGAVAYLATFLVRPERPGLLYAIATAVVGEDLGWQAIAMVLTLLLLTATAQRVVYRRTGRVFVEHLVLILHAASFGMLLAPVEAVALRFLPQSIPGIEAMVAPVMVMYWVLALRDLFEESLPVTLLRAGLIFVLTLVLLIGVSLVGVGGQSLLLALAAALRG